MKWLNIDVELLRDERYLIAEPTDRATWLSLLAYCVGKENGGVIEEAATWKDRVWQQVVGVTLREINNGDGEGRLWWRDVCKCVIVWGYPLEQEAAAQRSRENGKAGGRPPKNPNPEPSAKPGKQPSAEPTPKPSGKPRRKPRKQKQVSPPLTLPPSGNLGSRNIPPVGPPQGGLSTTTATLTLFPDISDEDIDRYGPGARNSPRRQHECWDEFVTDGPPGMGFESWLAVKDHPRFPEFLDQAEGEDFETWLAVEEPEEARETA